MDKITRIHLAKVPYEIGVNAEQILKKYLDEIRDELDPDLAAEIMGDIEVRITEILSERNVKQNDVITAVDIEAVQEQLGLPEQFNDGEKKTEKKNSNRHEAKKLLRDPDGAYVGGVASGIAAYLSIDPIFIRLIFIALAFASGIGVALYLLLWLLVPAAKTNSDKLLMRGEPATAAALQRYRSGAERTIANLRIRSAVRICYRIFRVLFTATAAFFVLALLSSIGFGSAILYTQPLHPLYITYHLNYLMVALIWLFTMTIVGLLVVALLRLWRQRSATLKVAFIALSSLLVITLAGGAIVSPFIVSHYRNIYGDNQLMVVLPVEHNTLSTPTSLNLSANSNLQVSYQESSQPLHATYEAYPGMGRPNVSITNNKGSIYVEAKQLTNVVPNCVLDWCQHIYLPVKVTIYGPNLQKFTVNGNTELDVYNLDEKNLSLTAENNSDLNVSNSYTDNSNITAESGSNIDASDMSSQASTISAQNGTYVFGPVSNSLAVTLTEDCDNSGPLVELVQPPSSVTINGQTVGANTLNQNDCFTIDNIAPSSDYHFRDRDGWESPAVPRAPNLNPN